MQPHLKLKKLVVKICLHQDTFDYIMHKFPNLECCNVNLSFSEAFQNHIESWMTRHYEEKLWAFHKYLSSRRCDWFFTFGSFPLIEKHLQDTTNPVVRISVIDTQTQLHIQQDNITWIMANTKENTDKLTELFKKYQHVVKEACMKTSGNHETDLLLRALILECKGLEKLTYEKPTISVPLINFPVSYQILNSSLIMLKLIVLELQPEVLTAYSYGFPELRNLIIKVINPGVEAGLFVIDMPYTIFNHLQVHIDSYSFYVCRNKLEAFGKPRLLEIVSRKSGLQRFLIDCTASNQIEEFTTNKEYNHKLVINCVSIDFLSVSIHYRHVLKKCPLFL
ncbi:hypothetical protein RMATCC62417_11772 [Rhizopus microsporus]|nr:hypothetical protein RMATCC62417_11772 [Rhizopus microsporus]